jgi:hypothetical protein
LIAAGWAAWVASILGLILTKAGSLSSGLLKAENKMLVGLGLPQVKET